MTMRVLFATSEISPLYKTGGLGDVSAALPAALNAQGAEARLMLPGYPQVIDNLSSVRVVRRLGDLFGVTARVLSGVLPCGLTVYAVDAPEFFDRAGPSPYVDEAGKDWPDNHRRFAALGHVAAHLYLHDESWTPDVVHANDWQCGLAMAYLAFRKGPRPASLFTIHNLAYQGLFPKNTLAALKLPKSCFSVNGLEFHDKIGFLKAGLYYADHISTVSPTYAREIRTAAYGCGLHGLLSSRSGDLSGIMNGIDRDEWNPATDNRIAAPYKTPAGKAANKRALLDEFGLDKVGMDDPVFAVVSRMTWQKGLDLLLEACPLLLKQRIGLVVHGMGDRELEQRFAALARAWQGRVGVRSPYDEALAHRIHAGADAILMPSRFEPCGLVQLYGLRYGALPVVRRTGGLADSVTDAGADGLSPGGTGFLFDQATPAALTQAVTRAAALYRDRPRWQAIQSVAMRMDFGWKKAAEQYMDLYAVLARRQDERLLLPAEALSARAGHLHHEGQMI